MSGAVFLESGGQIGDNGIMFMSSGQGVHEMEQTGFFDLQDCYARPDKLGDALSQIDALVPWGNFRGFLREAGGGARARRVASRTTKC